MYTGATVLHNEYAWYPVFLLLHNTKAQPRSSVDAIAASEWGIIMLIHIAMVCTKPHRDGVRQISLLTL